MSYGTKNPTDSVKIYTAITSMGLAIQEVVPEFNRYVGAQIYAGVSNMIRCVTSAETSVLIPEDLSTLYTASRKQ